MATAGRIQSDVMCPFFVRESSAEHKIVCEGPKNATYSVSYASADEGQRVAYMKKYCCTGKYKKCALCKCIGGEIEEEQCKIESDENEAQFLELLRKIAFGDTWYYTGHVEILSACQHSVELIIKKNQEIALLSAGKSLKSMESYEKDAYKDGYAKGYKTGYRSGTSLERKKQERKMKTP